MVWDQENTETYMVLNRVSNSEFTSFQKSLRKKTPIPSDILLSTGVLVVYAI